MRWEQVPSGRVRHPFEPVILGLALLVIPVVLIEEAQTTGAWQSIAHVGNWIIWLGFLAELLFVLAVADRRWLAFRAHWLDVAIVVLTVPIVPAALASLRAVRLLRVLRLGAIGARALTAERALLSRKNFRFAAIGTTFVVVVAGTAIAYADAERIDNPWRGMWWAITTVTTVGYGDVTPSTVAGRLIAVALMLAGIGFLSILTAAIAARFVEEDTRLDELVATVGRIDERLARLEDELRQPGPAGSGRGSR